VSSEKSGEKPAAEESKSSSGRGGLLVLIPPLLNTLVILMTCGFLYYSKFVFKRPAIREVEERKRLEEAQKKIDLEAKKVVFYALDPITVNIASSPGESGSKGGVETRKLHYVNLGVAFETRGDRNKEVLESLKPYILDQVIFLLGKKTAEQLSTIQGRYVLQFQIQDAVNQIVATKAANPPHDPPVLHAFFNQLIVQ